MDQQEAEQLSEAMFEQFREWASEGRTFSSPAELQGLLPHPEWLVSVVELVVGEVILLNFEVAAWVVGSIQLVRAQLGSLSESAPAKESGNISTQSVVERGWQISLVDGGGRLTA